MPARNKDEAKRFIDRLSLQRYADRAVSNRKLARKDVPIAITEYKQFLLLVWANSIMSNTELVVPSGRADEIWHEHLLDSPNYRTFSNQLVGRYIDHSPGLKEGTARHTKAVEHTRSLQQEYGSGGYTSSYLAACGAYVPMFGSESSSRHDSSPHHDSSDASSHGSHSSDSGSSGGGDSGGGGASCGGGGGGGCGGGGGGGGCGGG